MGRMLLSTLLLLLCSGQVLPCLQTDGTEPLTCVQRRLWLTGPDTRVIGFDGAELPQWPIDGGKARKFTFEQLVCGVHQDEEHQPQRDQVLPEPHQAELVEIRQKRSVESSVVASDVFGKIFFAAGVIGWIALGGAVVVVERRR